MSDVIKITPDMKRQFRSETTEHLNNFEKMLMVIEKDHHNHEAIHSAFRDIHSIKGNSDYLGIKDINTLSHDLEDLMDDLRGGKIPVYKDVLELLFQGLDILRDMNRRVVDEDYEESDISVVQARIRQIKSPDTEGLSEQKPETSDSDLIFSLIEHEIKVGIEKIDEFMNHASELTIAKNILNYLSEMIISGKQVSECAGKLRKVSADINKISNNLQADVMKLRLVKINTLFERLPRIVRDLSQENRKKINLSVTGGETEIDSKTIEQLTDPLVHLIRNSVDHGIEMPDKRLEKGKPESGSIIVSAHEQGNYAVIDISDDGAGIDIDEIRQEALKKKIVTKQRLISMTDDDIMNLVFIPGFSTSSKATKVSGRGVGLDIVRNNINMIGGNITLSSEKGVSTRMRLRIPVSMFVTDVLITEVAGRQYAFPFSSILKTIKIRTKEIRGKRKFILFNGNIIIIRYLSEILEIGKKSGPSDKNSDKELPVVVIKLGNQVCGIIVDKILNRESILIKPLERYFSEIREFSGTALLGDGSIVLVIDPMGMVKG